MNTRVYFVLGGALALLFLALMLAGRARKEAQVVADRSFPAVRALGDLRELLAQAQITLLENRQGSHTGSQPEELATLTQTLAHAADLIQEHKATIMSPRGAELCERVEQAFALYRDAASGVPGKAGELEDGPNLPNFIVAYHNLQRELAVLREYRLGRAETRISDIEEGARRTQQTNLIAMGALLSLMALTWFGSRATAHDRH